MGSTADTHFFSVPEVLGLAAPALREPPLVLSTRFVLWWGTVVHVLHNISSSHPARLLQSWSDSSLFDGGKALLSSDADKLQSRPLPVEIMRRRHVLALNLVMTAARAPGLSTSSGILPALHVFVQSLLLGISSFKLAQLSLLCSAGSSTCSHSSSSVLDPPARQATYCIKHILVSHENRKLCGYLLLNKVTHDLEFFHLHKWPLHIFALEV